MKKIVTNAMVPLFLVLLCTGEAATAAVDMKEGEWEIVSETSMSMGGMSMPGMTSKVTHCLTREDPVPASEKEKDCRMEKMKVSGNTVSWRVVCKDGEGEGEITYRGTSYKGTFRMKTTGGGEGTKRRPSRRRAAEGTDDDGPMTMTMKLSGKYLGPCPKGQKSGPTGETAKMMARAQEGQAQAKRSQAEMEAQRKKAEAFIKKAAVPAEEPGACSQAGFRWSEICERKVGKLNLQDGEYEITIEDASKTATFVTLGEVKKETVSLGEDRPVPDALLSAGHPRPDRVMRGKSRITWNAAAGASGTRGGVSYRGTSFEGVVVTKTASPGGQEITSVRKVTGRRIGEAKVFVGRSYSARRGYSVTAEAASGKPGGSAGKNGGSGDSATHTDNILKNPVKRIRNLFGF
ncbi:MAG: hypothetical protein OHK0028_24550 [Deltaproteobacteria bacterium]